MQLVSSRLDDDVNLYFIYIILPTEYIITQWCAMCLNGGNLHLCGTPDCNRVYCDSCVPTPAGIDVKMKQITLYCPSCHVKSERQRKSVVKPYQPKAYYVNLSIMLENLELLN